MQETGRPDFRHLHGGWQMLNRGRWNRDFACLPALTLMKLLAEEGNIWHSSACGRFDMPAMTKS